MKNLILIIFIIISTLVISEKAKALHIYGADVSWTVVGKDSFLIQMVYYRDCNGITPGNLMVNVRCLDNGDSLGNLLINQPTGLNITPVCVESNSRCNNVYATFPYGIQKYVYTQLIILNPNITCCNIQLSFTECCRMYAISTISPDQSLYVLAKMNRCYVPQDNSPQFSLPPLNVLCVGVDQILNFGVIDTDKDSAGRPLDSLSIMLTPPLKNINTPITYTGSYTYDKPILFWGFPDVSQTYPRGFRVDNSTGDIKFRPMKVEQTVMAVKVREYRKINGTLTMIGEVSRDVHFVVMSCPQNANPIITTGPNFIFHAGQTADIELKSFDANSSDTVRLYYNNAIPGASWSVNNGEVKNPIGKISWPTSYKMRNSTHYFHITAFDNACPLKGSSAMGFSVKLLDSLKIKLPDDTKLCYNQTKMLTPVVYNSAGYDSFLWSTGATSNAIIIGPITKDTIIWVRVKDAAKSYAYDTIKISYNGFKASFMQDVVVCPGIPSRLIMKPDFDKGTSIDSVKWFRYVCHCYSGNNDTLVVYDKTKYLCEAWDNTGCKYSDTISAKYFEEPIISLTYINPLCSNDEDIKLDSFGHPVSGTWYAQNPYLITNNTFHVKDAGPGQFLLSYYYTDSSTGCSSTEKMILEIRNAPEITFNDYSDSICEKYGTYLLSALPPNGIWSGKGVEKTNDWYFNPDLINVNKVGKFSLTYLFTDSNSCSDMDSMELTVFEDIQADAGFDMTICLNISQVNLNGLPKGGTWFGKGVYGNKFYPLTAGSGNHTLYYNYSNELCTSVDSVNFFIPSAPDSALTKQNDTLFAVKGMISYQWYRNGIMLNGETNEYIRPTQEGVYYVHYYDQYGCSYRSKSYSFIGLQEVANDLFRIFPNPSHQKIIITENNTCNNHVFVKLINSTGEILIYRILDENREIDLSSFQAGVYFIELNSDLVTFRCKIIKL